MSSGRESPVLVYVAEGAALVWSVGDSRRLREELRLCGSPVGSLVRQPRQNGRLGLPLRLMPEEARYLAESGGGLLVRRCCRRQGAVSPPTEGAAELHREGLRRSHAEQRLLALQDKRRLLQALAERIRHGREDKRKRRQEGGEGECDHAEDIPSPLPELEDLDSSFSFPLDSTLVQIHTACAHNRFLELVNWQVPSPDWPYPSDTAHNLHYQVFKDLHAKGYYLTSAGKFGAHFLAYPGDPMRFHSYYLVLCLPVSKLLPLHDTVSVARLGTSVRKTVLLCSLSQDSTVIYTSLRWRRIQ